MIVEPEDIFGDGVNVAARLEALAEPDGICISQTVYEQIRDKLPYPFEDIGQQSVKNIARPLQVFALRPEVDRRSAAHRAAPAAPMPAPIAALRRARRACRSSCCRLPI